MAAMPYRRRRRRRRIKGAAVLRVAARIARAALVVLVAVAVGYAFYYALRWVAAEADRRDSALRAPPVFIGERVDKPGERVDNSYDSVV